MMRLATLVVLVMVLAGCGGAESKSQPTVVTPAPVPDAETRSETVTTRGETGIDPVALANAHGAALNDSYTVTANQTITTRNGSIWAHRRMSFKLAPDHTRFHLRLSVAGPHAIGILGRPPAHAEFWSANGSRIFRAFTVDNHTTYNAFAPRFSLEVGVVGTASYWEGVVLPGGQAEEDIEPLVRHLDVERDENDRGLGPGESRLRADGFRDSAAFARAESFHVSDFLGDLHNVSFTAVVDREGHIRQYRLAYSGRIDDTPVRVIRIIRIRHVRSTTVPRPSWYEQARDESDPT